MHLRKLKILDAIAIVLLMTSVMLVALPDTLPVKGASVTIGNTTITNVQPSGGVPNIPTGVTPDYSAPTFLYLSVSPNPIGLNQYFLVNIWTTPPLEATHYRAGYVISITKPDGTKDSVTIDSYYADTTAWFPYVADQVGNWTFTASWGGAYYAAGNYTSPAIRSGATMAGGTYNPQVSQSLLWDPYPYSFYAEPCQTPQATKVTVQQNMVSGYPEPALPGAGQYWSRPVEPSNRYWWSIMGNYPFVGPGGLDGWPDGTNIYNTGYQFTPWVTAPQSAHIVWKQQGAIGGLVGPVADMGQIVNENWQTAGGNPNICYAGRCYQTVTRWINNAPTSVWECYDLQTGKVYWDLTGPATAAPTQLEYALGSGDTPGATAIRGETVYLVYIGNSRLIKYDPYTGATVLNMSIAPLTTGTYYKNGFALSIQDLGAAAGANRYRLINWTTINNAITSLTGNVTLVQTTGALDGHGFGLLEEYTGRIVSNTSYALSSLPGLIDYQTGVGAVVTSVNDPGSIVTDTISGTVITGYDVATGIMKWNITVADHIYSGSTNQADHGMIAVKFKSGYYRAYSLATGNLVWTSDKMDYPWDDCGFGAYAAQSAYGLLYNEAYSGVYAFNWTTGHIQWKFEAAAPDFETPYTGVNGTQVYSWDSAGKVANGMLFTCNSEHSPSSPVIRGWSMWAINVSTGTQVWHILGEMDPGVFSDGYMTASNNYDGYMYVFGMGLSATTVTTSPAVISKGATTLIQGTVMDKSPAQPNTPCVSKDSMSTQMAYIHMQASRNGLWGNETITGVPVTLTAIDSSNNVINIGTTTSEGYDGTYSMPWTPPAEGTYKIIATFAGDVSYSYSEATTYVNVGSALATPTPTVTSAPSNLATTNDLMTYMAAGVIAIIIVIVIVGIMLYRKKA